MTTQAEREALAMEARQNFDRACWVLNEYRGGNCDSEARDAAFQAVHSAIDRLAAAPAGEQPVTFDEASRRMFVARIEHMYQQGDKWISTAAVLALLNDCDMLAQRETTPLPAAGEQPDTQRLRDALELMWDRYENGDPCRDSDDPVEGNFIGNAVRLFEDEEREILALIPTTPSKPTRAFPLSMLRPAAGEQARPVADDAVIHDGLTLAEVKGKLMFLTIDDLRGLVMTLMIQRSLDSKYAAPAPASAAALLAPPRCTCLTGQLGPDYCEVHAA